MKEFTFDHVKACFPRGTIVDELSMTVDSMPISYGPSGTISNYTPMSRTLMVSGCNLDIFKLNPKFKHLFSHLSLNKTVTHNTFKVFIGLSDQSVEEMINISQEVFDSEFIEDFETAEV